MNDPTEELLEDLISLIESWRVTSGANYDDSSLIYDKCADDLERIVKLTLLNDRSYKDATS